MPSCRATTAKGHRCRLPASRAKVGGNSELLNRCRHHIEQLDDFLGSHVEGQANQVEITQIEVHRPTLQSSSPTASTQTSADIESVRPSSRSTSQRRATAAPPSTKASSSDSSPPTPQERPAASHKTPPSTFGLGSSSPQSASIRAGPSPPVADALAARPEPVQYFATPSQDRPKATLPPSSSEIVIYLDYRPSTQTYQRTVALRTPERDHECMSNADRGRRHGSAPPDVSSGFCRKRINPPLPRYMTPVKKRHLKGMRWWQSGCRIL